MSNKNITIMVVPQWFPNTPEVIRELAYVAEYYNRDCHKLFQVPYSFTDVNESLRVFFMLEGLTQRLTHIVPRDNYHHVQMTKRLLHEVNSHYGASLDFLSNKLLMRQDKNVKFHDAFDVDVKDGNTIKVGHEMKPINPELDTGETNHISIITPLSRYDEQDVADAHARVLDLASKAVVQMLEEDSN